MVTKNYFLKKRAFALLVMLLTVVSASAYDEQSITIGKMDITQSGTYYASDHTADGWVSGSVTWDKDTKTLTLNELSVEMEKIPALELWIDSYKHLNVKVIGECRFTSHSSDDGALLIGGFGNIYFDDGGNSSKLIAESTKGYGIQTYIKGNPTIYFRTATAINSVKNSIHSSAKDIATVHVAADMSISSTNGQPVYQLKDLIFDRCGITAPRGAHFYEGQLWDKKHKKAVTGSVTIESAEWYGFNICGTEVNNTNYDCIDSYHFPNASFSKDGCISYDKNNNSLDINYDCVIMNNSKEPTIENESCKELIIQLFGDAHFTYPSSGQSNAIGIAVYAETTIRSFNKKELKLTMTNSSTPNAGTIYVSQATLNVESGDQAKSLEILTPRIYGLHSLSGDLAGKLAIGQNTKIKVVGNAKAEATVCDMEVSVNSLYNKGTPVLSTQSAPAFYWKDGPKGPGIYKSLTQLVTGEVILTTDGLETYDLKVFGEKVNSNNCDNILNPKLKSGLVRYKPLDQWLVLDGAEVDMKGLNASLIESSVSGLQIRITGKNLIENNDTYPHSCMELSASTTLMGLGNGGSFECKGKQVGVRMYGNTSLTITGPNVSYKLPAILPNAVGKCAVTIETPVTLTGSKFGTMNDFRQITLKNSLNPYDSNGVLLEVKNGSLVDAEGEVYKGEVRFAKSTFDDPRITVGDVAVSEANMNDVLGDGGSVKYSPDGKLTLTNATVNGTDYALRTQRDIPLEIVVNGSCTLKSSTAGSSTGPNTMSLAGNITFTGTGTLVAQQGINVMASDITVDGPYVRCNSKDLMGCQGGERLVVKSGKLYARIIQGFKEFTLADGIAITTPEGGYYNGHYVAKADGTQAIGVMIGPGTPYIAPTGISLSQTSLSMTYVGETVTLWATVSPNDATNRKVTWSSGNTAVATVSGGKVKAVGNGTCTITAETVNGEKATCEVTVNTTVLATKLTLNKDVLTLRIFDEGYGYRENEKLVPVFEPTNVTDNTVEWNIEDQSVATINEYGRVEAVSFGETIVTCTAKDGSGLTATCTVKVVSDLDASDDFEIDISNDEDIYIGMACRITDRDNNYCEVVSRLYDPDNFINDPAIDIYTEGDITIPAEARTYQITRIGDHAFTGCNQLTSVTLPEGLQAIGYEAFNGCTYLETLYLPSTLLSADNYAFSGCPSVKDIYLFATTPPDFGQHGFNFGSWYNPEDNPIRTLHVPAASLKLYKQQAWTKWFDKILPIGRVAGDTDGDGEVTSTDAEAITDYLLGKAPADFDTDAADFDGDGEVTITDITSIIQSIIEE